MNLPTTSVLFNYKNQRNKKGLYSIHMRVTLERKSILLKFQFHKRLLKQIGILRIMALNL